MAECFLLWKPKGRSSHVTLPMWSLNLNILSKWPKFFSRLLQSPSSFFNLHQCSSTSPFPSVFLHSSLLQHARFVQPCHYLISSFILYQSMFLSIYSILPMSAPCLLYLSLFSSSSSSLPLPFHLSFPLSPFFSLPCPCLPCHHLISISSSFHLFPSRQRTVQEAGTSTCTRRLSGVTATVFVYVILIQLESNWVLRGGRSGWRVTCRYNRKVHFKKRKWDGWEKIYAQASDWRFIVIIRHSGQRSLKRYKLAWRRPWRR